jgi:hypothetical protein
MRFAKIVMTGAIALLIPATVVLAAAPKSKNIPPAVDSAAGSISDPQGLLKVDLDRPVSIAVANQPAIVVYNQLTAFLNISFGYAQGVNSEALVTMNSQGTGRQALHALGVAARVRFEAVGPLQMRVMPAGSAASPKPKQEPPPVKIK